VVDEQRPRNTKQRRYTSEHRKKKLDCRAVRFAWRTVFGGDGDKRRGAPAADGVILINQATVTAGGGFPYTISQSGSYKLSGPLTASANVSAIVIGASNVLLDLNGFTITCQGTQNPGITTPATVTGGAIIGVKIRNGSITGCYSAVDMSRATDAEIDAIQASNYQLTGILISNGIVRGCSTYGATGAPGPFVLYSNGISYNSSFAIIEGNRLSNDYFGIVGEGLARISGNVISASGAGMDIRSNGKFAPLIGGNDLGAADAGVLGGVSQGNNSCNGLSC
jgi:hypothetical protein